jgi:hypothetical protein
MQDELRGLNQADLREVIREAIYKIATTGQSYKIGTRSLTRADLGQLRALLKDLESQTEELPGALPGVNVSMHDRR